MRRGFAALLAALLVAPVAAAAHGPCVCTHPDLVRPGMLLRTGPAYKVIWNPSRGDFVRQSTQPQFAVAHRADAPTGVVFRQRRAHYPHRTRPGRFRVPHNTPPGAYFVLIFDGSEGGAHTTWDYVTVHDPRRAASAGFFGPLVAAVRAVVR